jgi:hypothetical protein
MAQEGMLRVDTTYPGWRPPLARRADARWPCHDEFVNLMRCKKEARDCPTQLTALLVCINGDTPAR